MPTRRPAETALATAISGPTRVPGRAPVISMVIEEMAAVVAPTSTPRPPRQPKLHPAAPRRGRRAPLAHGRLGLSAPNRIPHQAVDPSAHRIPLNGPPTRRCAQRRPGLAQANSSGDRLSPAGTHPAEPRSPGLTRQTFDSLGREHNSSWLAELTSDRGSEIAVAGRHGPIRSDKPVEMFACLHGRPSEGPRQVAGRGI